jgi:hypothetical protein
VVVGGGLDPVTKAGAAFYWTAETGMLGLREVLIFAGATGLDNWRLISAEGVSEDGLTIVGTGIGPNGQEAFVATVPEPSTVLLGALAVAGSTILILIMHGHRRKANYLAADVAICVASALKGRAANGKVHGVCVSNQFVDPIIGSGI